MNILIADDDPITVRVLSSALRRSGFATSVAFDVMQATQMIRQQSFHAVILDMAMPGGSGSDVIQRLKLFRRTLDIPIVVVSGSVDKEAREKILELGVDDFFAKPADPDQLVASVRRLTQKFRSPEVETKELAVSEPLKRAAPEKQRAWDNDMIAHKTMPTLRSKPSQTRFFRQIGRLDLLLRLGGAHFLGQSRHDQAHRVFGR